MKLKIFSLILLFGFFACATKVAKIKTGAEAFELRQYAKAIPLLLEEYEATKNKESKAQLSYYLARSYERINDDRNMLKWYEKSAELEYGAEVYKYLGFAYKKMELYDRAISAFELWEQETGLVAEARREINICRQAKEWKKGDQSIVVHQINVNSQSAEYAPVIYEDSYIVFTSDRPGSMGNSIYEWTGNNFSDLYISSKSGDDPILFDDKINSEHNEGVACFNSDFTEIFFTRCYQSEADDFCKILWSIREGPGWSNPREPFNMSTEVNYGHPTLVENDSVLIFSSNSPNGYGEYDLYYAIREIEGNWSEPELMPESLNTQGNEKFPRAEGDTLFFSSDYLPGLGGLDIFKTVLGEDGKWSDPVNVRAPINSGSDDFSYIVDRSKSSFENEINKGFFSSSREGTGNDDIYKFIQYKLDEPVKETPVAIEEEDESDEEKRIFIAVRVVTNQYENPEDPDSKLIGKVPIPNALINIILNGGTEEAETDDKGRIIIDGIESSSYIFKVSTEGYLTNSSSLKTASKAELTGSETYNIEVNLSKIYYDKEIVLDNIYYDLNKWFIRDDAKPTLDSLGILMNDNPDIRIELGSHTDCRGRPEFNDALSERRAGAAVEYLESIGIAGSRMRFRGYGESNLSNNCICQLCNEEQHQENRRTTFRILE